MAGSYQKLQQSRQDLDVLWSKGEALVDLGRMITRGGHRGPRPYSSAAVSKGSESPASESTKCAVAAERSETWSETTKCGTLANENLVARDEWCAIEHNDVPVPVKTPRRPAPTKPPKESQPNRRTKHDVWSSVPRVVNVTRINFDGSTINTPRIVNRQITSVCRYRFNNDR